ncbi:unnamed protein product [Cyclocybe aegerita]|uniref:Uncharacterized protein n=1 Tax=Cyclocybe aegerita TaxID=1973307 RepID=A0A8S0WM68_CYCAE|nr:unnamed protein product [Cyclocybe aegerita]
MPTYKPPDIERAGGPPRNPLPWSLIIDIDEAAHRVHRRLPSRRWLAASESKPPIERKGYGVHGSSTDAEVSVVQTSKSTFDVNLQPSVNLLSTISASRPSSSATSAAAITSSSRPNPSPISTVPFSNPCHALSHPTPLPSSFVVVVSTSTLVASPPGTLPRPATPTTRHQTASPAPSADTHSLRSASLPTIILTLIPPHIPRPRCLLAPSPLSLLPPMLSLSPPMSLPA